MHAQYLSLLATITASYRIGPESIARIRACLSLSGAPTNGNRSSAESSTHEPDCKPDPARRGGAVRVVQVCMFGTGAVLLAVSSPQCTHVRDVDALCRGVGGVGGVGGVSGVSGAAAAASGVCAKPCFQGSFYLSHNHSLARLAGTRLLAMLDPPCITVVRRKTDAFMRGLETAAQALCCSHDQLHIAGATDARVCIWETATMKLVASLDLPIATEARRTMRLYLGDDARFVYWKGSRKHAPIYSVQQAEVGQICPGQYAYRWLRSDCVIPYTPAESVQASFASCRDGTHVTRVSRVNRDCLTTCFRTAVNGKWFTVGFHNAHIHDVCISTSGRYAVCVYTGVRFNIVTACVVVAVLDLWSIASDAAEHIALDRPRHDYRIGMTHVVPGAINTVSYTLNTIHHAFAVSVHDVWEPGSSSEPVVVRAVINVNRFANDAGYHVVEICASAARIVQRPWHFFGSTDLAFCSDGSVVSCNGSSIITIWRMHGAAAVAARTTKVAWKTLCVAVMRSAGNAACSLTEGCCGDQVIIGSGTRVQLVPFSRFVTC